MFGSARLCAGLAPGRVNRLAELAQKTQNSRRKLPKITENAENAIVESLSVPPARPRVQAAHTETIGDSLRRKKRRKRRDERRKRRILRRKRRKPAEVAEIEFCEFCAEFCEFCAEFCEFCVWKMNTCLICAGSVRGRVSRSFGTIVVATSDHPGRPGGPQISAMRILSLSVFSTPANRRFAESSYQSSLYSRVSDKVAPRGFHMSCARLLDPQRSHKPHFVVRFVNFLCFLRLLRLFCEVLRICYQADTQIGNPKIIMDSYENHKIRKTLMCLHIKFSIGVPVSVEIDWFQSG